MDKFKSKFFEKSPIKEVARGRASRLRKRAQRRSERSGETGGYDYSDMKVLKLLGKAKNIENKNFIKDLGFKKGSKSKKSMYREDPRIQASFERPDVDNSSPLQGAYTSGADGVVYVSNRDAFQDLQDKITEGFNKIIEAEKDPQLQKEKQQRRKARQQKRLESLISNKNLVKKEGVTSEKEDDIYVVGERFEGDKSKDVGKVSSRATKLQERINRREDKIKSLDDLIEQRRKDKRSRNFLTAAEKTEIVKQHYLSEGGTEEEWNALPTKAKKQAVLDYRTYYGFDS
jgi:hypothetical protein